MRIISTNKKGIISGNPRKEKDYLPNSFLKYHSSGIKYLKGPDHYIFQYDIKQPDYPGQEMNWSSDGKYLVSWDFNTVYLYDVTELKTINRIKLIRTFDYSPWYVQFSPDSKKLAFLFAPGIESGDGEDNNVVSSSEILIYSMSTLTTNLPNPPPYKIIKASDYPNIIEDRFFHRFEWSKDGSTIFVGSQIPIENLVENSQLTGLTGVVIGINMTSYQITNIFYYNLDNEDEDMQYFGVNFKLSLDGTKIIINSSYSGDVFIYQIDLSKYKDSNYLNRFKLQANDFEFSPDGSKVAISYVQGININDIWGNYYYVNIYDNLSNINPTLIKTLNGNGNLKNNLFGSSISWSSNGEKLAINYLVSFNGGEAGGIDGYVYVYDTTNFNIDPNIFTNNKNTLEFAIYIKYSPDGSILGVSGLSNNDTYENVLYFYQ